MGVVVRGQMSVVVCIDFDSVFACFVCIFCWCVCVCVVAPEKIDNVGVRVCVFRFFIFSFVFVPCCDFCFYFGFVVFPFFFCFFTCNKGANNATFTPNPKPLTLNPKP